MRPWPALDQARATDPAARVPFFIGGRRAGSVARAHLGALARLGGPLEVAADAVHLVAPRAERVATLAALNQRLRAQGLIVAWRDETYPVHALDDGTLLATHERAAARFWGTLTFGAHCNGYVANAQGRPTHLWIAQRSLTKPTDPGLLDNLVGGGVPLGQHPRETLVREAWEEAGLTPAQLAGLQPGRVLELHRDIPEGLQLEHLWVHDLALPAGLTPANQDGEVAALHCLPLPEALDATARMTVDAALATLDFALRHGLLPEPEARALAPRLAALCPVRTGFAFNQTELPPQGP